MKTENKLIVFLRKSARPLWRKLGFAKAVISFHQLRAQTVKGALKMYLAKRRYLTKILEAKPIPAGEGAIEVHMLLHHKRIYEGLWALYSFAYFCAQPCRIVVHSDGSLTDLDVGLLNRLFPQCKVIDRETADSLILSYFRKEGLVQCAQFREDFVLTLKLFDPFFFLDSKSFIFLDSDVLFFSHPQELIDGIESVDNASNISNLYFVDFCNAYTLQPAELATLLGENCIEKVNTGVLRVRQNILDFKRIERYLQQAQFSYEKGKFNHFAEQTLWAMELTKSNNTLPLPNTYAIAPSGEEADLVSGHFCGGGYSTTMFYRAGLPRLAASFLG
ncbi:MAG: hypothetical protein KME54_05750 [Tolypothrix brevis GSE-NOS-MK-07-07A]|jgi:hypothetical protein|nr:hypothetical protein [Tolypothrix brevis GSE-NOS-MK-07-07A]